jgi:uncharacterized protein (DUF58 family)
MSPDECDGVVMLPHEIVSKLRYIQICSSKAVNEMLAGEYHSVFKGRGVEFHEVREYQTGDDVRSVDWNVTARMGRPFVKRYVEERQLSLFFVVDLSASGRFGSTDKAKNEIAAELCALLAFSAIKNNDKVGLLIFTNKVELFIPPGKGTSHVLRIIRTLLCFEPHRKGTDISGALEYLGRLHHKKSVVFLVSDFLDSGYQRPMQVIARRHDLIAVSVRDPGEIELPDAGLMTLVDAETGKRVVVDSSCTAVRQAFFARAQERQRALAESFAVMEIDHIPVACGNDYLRDLIVFFRQRERKQSGEYVR